MPRVSGAFVFCASVQKRTLAQRSIKNKHLALKRQVVFGISKEDLMELSLWPKSHKGYPIRIKALYEAWGFCFCNYKKLSLLFGEQRHKNNIFPKEGGFLINKKNRGELKTHPHIFSHTKFLLLKLSKTQR